MNTQNAVRLGIELSTNEKRKLFNTVTTWRNFGGLIEVPKEHVQALALVCKHASKSCRNKLVHDEWFTNYAGESEAGGDGPSAWITRKGMIYPIQYAGHDDFGSLIGVYSTGTIERAGWIHVSGGRADIMYAVTGSQAKALDRLRAHGNIREKRVSSYHPINTDHLLLQKLDRVPRENFVADANFWADEHGERTDGNPV